VAGEKSIAMTPNPSSRHRRRRRPRMCIDRSGEKLYGLLDAKDENFKPSFSVLYLKTLSFLLPTMIGFES